MTVSNYYADTGIPYYRGGDIYNFFIEKAANPLKISQEAFDLENMKRSHIKKGG